MNHKWPAEEEIDEHILLVSSYLEGVIRDVRLAITQPKRKKKGVDNSKAHPTNGILFVTDRYPEWQNEVVDAVKELYSKSNIRSFEMKDLLSSLKSTVKGEIISKNRKFQNFVKEMKDLIESHGASSLERKLKFNEEQILKDNMEYIKSSLGLNTLKVKRVEDVNGEEEVQVAAAAVPGSPSYYLAA